MEYAVIFLAGLLSGCIVTLVVTRLRKVGWLRIDRSIQDENPYLFLELSNAIEVVSKRKYVTLKVLNKNYLSQK